ncbi:MAG TPA: hypothetical protein DEG69_14330 [Flavobacteriaceae bacterium]|nr:hypothetical protein [Flavobacteriaceae bacterium]
MLTIIGSLIGFGSSFLPSILDFFKEKESNRHELALMDKQAELTRITAEFERDKAEVQALSAETVALYQQASTEKNDGWVGAYRASVRPTISYLFLLFYIGIKSFSLYGMIQYEGMMIKDALPLVWSPEVDSPILASIISFYFGSRMFRK